MKTKTNLPDNFPAHYGTVGTGTTVHPDSFVYPSGALGENVTIGPGIIMSPHAAVADGTVVTRETIADGSCRKGFSVGTWAEWVGVEKVRQARAHRGGKA